METAKEVFKKALEDQPDDSTAEEILSINKWGQVLT